jgi:hypothetical protein
MSCNDELLKERYFVCIGMMGFGGGFASKLGEALSNADEENIVKIAYTWPNLWVQYLEIGKKKHDKEVTR